MSIDAAIGRIDQIYTLQQQLLDPAAAAAGGSASSAGGSAVSSTASGSTPSTDFATALAAAQGLTQGTSASSTTAAPGGLASAGGLSSASGALGVGGVGGVSVTGGSAPPQVQAMVNQANSLIGKPYVWGGGHSGWGPQSGYDCSGFVSAVLHAGGYLSAPQDTQTLPSQAGIEAGPGQYVTIYDRTDAGSSDDHVIIDLNGQFYESGGEAGAWGGGGGVEKIATPSQSYLSTFNQVLHPAGL